MDNKRILVVSDDKEDFSCAMKIAMSNYSKVIGFRVDDNKLILYWAKSEKMNPLPYEMNVSETEAFVWGWLDKNKPKYSEPDHDGDNSKGFKIENDSWGQVQGEWQAFISIEPIWAMYGK